MPGAIFQFIFILLLSLSTSAREINFTEEARRISLSENEKAYEKFILSLRAGDVLLMGDGERFTIQKLLGKGHQHGVFSIQESADWVLRLPYRLASHRSTLDTLEGYETLKKTSLRTVHIHPGSNWEYVLAERVTSDHFTMLDFLSGRRLGDSHPLQTFELSETNAKHNGRVLKMIEKAPAISPKELATMEEALVLFSSSLAEFLQIHDLKSNQLFYDRKNKEWILLDWLNLIELYSPQHDGLNDSVRELVFGAFKGSNRYLGNQPGLKLPQEMRDRWMRVASRMRMALLEKRLKLRGLVSCERAFTF